MRHRAWGRVFGDRYKAVLVEGGKRFYYETLMDYIHLNPVRAPWLAATKGLEVFGFPDTAAGRRRMVERLERRGALEGNARVGGFGVR